ncbi:hypothetical protein [Streptosporangium sp. NPDC087985]|uniref:hypothetical protein n=1 Tax=Streptosporangium sp. NPDC087985 TaxID=3366196 RepID=UPI00380ECA5E
MRFSFGIPKSRFFIAATLIGASAITSASVVSLIPSSAVASSSALPAPALSVQAPPVQAPPVQALPASAKTSASTPGSESGSEVVLLNGSTKASYFWDDSSGRAGDTGLPASGKPMQKGMIASPSWPLMTEGYVIYNGKKANFFVGDRGPGVPSSSGVMIDLDAKTFAELTGGTFNPNTLGVDGTGGLGHIKVDYVITKWGSGPGKKNYPVPFSAGAWKRIDNNPATPPQVINK